MKIIESGFYNVTDNQDSEITIGDNINVIIFDTRDNDRQIILGSNSRLEVYGYLNNSDGFNKQVILKGDNSQLKLGYLLFTGKNQSIKAKISGKIKANNTKINLKIVSMVLDDSKVDIDGILQIEKGFKQAVGKLEENNIFLGENGIINSVPALLVQSNDVDLSHSCKIEKISEQELFYLRSKGISKDTSIQMILNSYVNNLFKCLKMFNNELYEEVIQDVEGKITHPPYATLQGTSLEKGRN